MLEPSPNLKLTPATAESSASVHGSHADAERKRRPVFVMGCHRSGTNLLYDTLLSAGGFAVYRGYLPIYEILVPRFGSLENPRNRRKAVDTWMKSKGFRRAGVESEPLSSELLAGCRNGGDFIRIVMDKVALSQNVPRWAVYEPDSVLHVPRIKKDIPDALFVHIIRDGRDIALSLMKMEGFRPFPWSRRARTLLETALYWQWTVHQGRQHGRAIPEDYIEIHYEANSSFRGNEKEMQNPVNRWKEKLSHQQVVELEALIGPTLKGFGYPLAIEPEQRRLGLRSALRLKSLASVYPLFLSAKQWLKLNTPMGRFASLSALEVQEEAPDRADHESPGA